MPPPRRPRPTPQPHPRPVILILFAPDFRGQILIPNSTAPDTREGAEARVKDPLWFLARQWETGEFEAENGGRPVHFDVEWESWAVDHITLGETRARLMPTTRSRVR